MSPRTHNRQRGAALLMAMIILTLVATIAAGMVWQQSKAIEVETAERARAQSSWILNGALDWSRIILSEDARNGGADHLAEPWATPLAEARLSSFLAVDKDNNADPESGPEAFLSGSIEDMQSRYNLRRLIVVEKGKNTIVPEELETLQRLFDTIGLQPELATAVAQGLRDAWSIRISPDANAPVSPETLDQLRWLGIDEESIKRMRPYVAVLPDTTLLNLNTAPREVIAAVLKGLGLGGADRLVQRRLSNPFHKLEDATSLLPPSVAEQVNGKAGYQSSYFEVRGRLRLGDQVQEEVALMNRRGREVVPIWRTRSQVLRGN